MRFTKCLEKLKKNKDRHLVNLKLGQQDEKSVMRQLYFNIINITKDEIINK